MSVRCTKTNVCPDTDCEHYDRHEKSEDCKREICIVDETIKCKCTR